MRVWISIFPLISLLSWECESRQLARVWKRSEPYYLENGRVKNSRRLYRLHQPSNRIQAARTFNRYERNVRLQSFMPTDLSTGPVLSKSSGRFYRKIAASPTHRIGPQTPRNDSTLYGPWPYPEERHHKDKLKETERLLQDSRDMARTMGRTTMRTKFFTDIDRLTSTTTVKPKIAENLRNSSNHEATTRASQQQVEPSQMFGEKSKKPLQIDQKTNRNQPQQMAIGQPQPFTMQPPMAPQFALPFQPQAPQPQAPDFSLFQQPNQFGGPPPPPPQQPQFAGPLTGFQPFAQPSPPNSPFFQPQPPQQGQFGQPPSSMNRFQNGFPPQLPQIQQPQFSQQPNQPVHPNQRLNGPLNQQQLQLQSFNNANQLNNNQGQLPNQPIVPQTNYPQQQSAINQPIITQLGQAQGQQQQQLQQVPPPYQTTSPFPPNNNGFGQESVSLSPQAANNSLEAYGCAFDFMSQTCKDLFALGWCGQCHDFGNVFVHDCKCIRPNYDKIPRAPPNTNGSPPPAPQPSPQTAFVRQLQRGLA